MVDPIQYLSPVQAGGFAQGYSLGNEMIQSRLLNAVNEEKLRQQQLATQQAQRQQEVLSNLMQKVRDGKVTSSDYEAATIELPNLREQMKQAFDIHSDKTKQGIVSEMSQVYSALSSKRPDLAKSVLQTRIDSMKNSGAPESEIQQVQTMLDNIETSPDFVMLNTGMMLQSIPGGDKIFQALDERRKQELQPGEVKKQEGELRQQAAQLGLTKAQTNKAMVEATYLPKKLAADIGLTQAQTQQALMAARKSAIEMAAAPPDQQKMQASLSAQQALDQANTVLNHPGRSIGTGVTSFVGKIPGTEAKGFQANLETFKAQTFIPMVSALKGMGALSDAEGKKLAASVGALDPDMPTNEFETSLKGTMDFLYKKAKAAGLDVNNPLEKREQAVGSPQGGGLPPGWGVTVR